MRAQELAEGHSFCRCVESPSLAMAAEGAPPLSRAFAEPKAAALVASSERLLRTLTEVHRTLKPHAQGTPRPCTQRLSARSFQHRGCSTSSAATDSTTTERRGRSLGRRCKREGGTRRSPAPFADPVQLADTRKLIADAAAVDVRILKQAIKVLQDVSHEAAERRRSSSAGAALPESFLKEVSRTAEDIAAGLLGVWSRYCASDLPGLLHALSSVWSAAADASCAPPPARRRWWH